MGTKSFTFRLDENDKKQVEQLFDKMGLTMSSALNIFVKAVIRQGKIPFEVSAIDPFYSEQNQAVLSQSIEQVKNGQVVVKSMDELERMADG